MGLSIITPHFNDFEGLQQILKCLSIQSDNNWEWIIVDDFSEESVLVSVRDWVTSVAEPNIIFIENTHKTNASVCRNIGVDRATFDRLIFLDADDYLGEDFVSNRQINFRDFAIFPNYKIVGKNSITIRRLEKEKDELLNSYLAANFLWQTTCVLWDKEFLYKIGKFDSNLHRLQDVELFIRALYASEEFKIIDNEPDFFYCAKPIRLKQDIVKKSCESVNYLISKLSANYKLNRQRQKLVKAYYFACVKGLYKLNDRKNVSDIRGTLKMCYKKKFISIFELVVGYILLFQYKNHLIPNTLFLKTNRYFFK